MPTAKPALRKKSSVKVKKSLTGKLSSKPDFVPVFTALRGMLKSFSHDVNVQTDQPGNFHTEIPSILHRGKPLYFAGVRLNKNYVSYYLMSGYYCPELLQGMSPELKKRKQGKACFNFTSVDSGCFAELEKLTAAGLKTFKTEKFRKSIERLQ